MIKLYAIIVYVVSFDRLDIQEDNMAHKSLFIIDNSSEANSVKSYISQWCSISKQLDIASGYFEVGGLLALGEEWQKLDKIRIILGNEVTKRTKNIIDEVASMMIEHFRESLENEQEKKGYLIEDGKFETNVIKVEC